MTASLRLALFVAMLAASASKADPPSPAPAPTPTSTPFPSLELDGLDDQGRPFVVRTAPSGSASGLLVVRVQGGTWCGTCLWHASHTAETLAGFGDRVRVLDLVLGGDDNQTATPSDAAAFRLRLDDPHGVTVAPVARAALGSLLQDAALVLPLVAVVDARTMGVLQVLDDPHLADLRRAIDADLAAADGRAPRPEPEESLVDGLFHRDEWDMVQAMGLPPAMTQPVPTEALSPVERLGKRLFFDAGLSSSGKVACATCHDPRQGLSDGKPRAVGIAQGHRRTPRIGLASFARHQFRDGRADTLDEQALAPLEAPAEMGASPASVAGRVAQAHSAAYRDAFSGRPLSDADAVFHDVGRAIAAYERTLRVRPTAIDAYAGGQKDALTFPEKQGLAMFLRLGCAQCHWGPRLTDDAFHVTRMASGDASGAPDYGRSAVTGVDDPATVGAFKTPSLRGVAGGAPFGHGGAQSTLGDVLAAYGNGGLPAEDPRAVGAREPWLPHLGETAQWSIAALLARLSAEPEMP